MIYDELRNYLVQSSSIETVDQIDKAVGVFDSFNVEDYMNLYDAAMGEHLDGSDEEMVDAILEVTTSLLKTLLDRFQVALSDDATLSDLIDVMAGLYKIETYEHPEGFFITLENTEVGKEEMFCELLALVNSDSVEKYLVVVTKVSQALMDRIKEVCTEANVNVDDSGDEISIRIKSYQKVQAAFNNEPSSFDYCLNHIGTVGMAFASYMKPYLIDHREYFAEPVAEHAFIMAAKDFLRMSALSLEGFAKTTDLLKTHAAEFFPALSSTTKFNQVVINLLTKVHDVKN